LTPQEIDEISEKKDEKQPLDQNLDLQKLTEFKSIDLELSNLLTRRTHKQQNKDFNNFQVRRSCFRKFSSYYKKKFSPLNKLWQR
jgi:hypothetical protein